MIDRALIDAYAEKCTSCKSRNVTRIGDDCTCNDCEWQWNAETVATAMYKVVKIILDHRRHRLAREAEEATKSDDCRPSTRTVLTNY